LRRYRETAQIAARSQGGDRRSKLKGKEQELLKIIVTEKSDIYLREIHSWNQRAPRHRGKYIKFVPHS
jgi:transposase